MQPAPLGVNSRRVGSVSCDHVAISSNSSCRVMFGSSTSYTHAVPARISISQSQVLDRGYSPLVGQTIRSARADATRSWPAKTTPACVAQAGCEKIALGRLSRSTSKIKKLASS